MMSAADTIKKVRMELNLDQQHFADALEITKTAIFNYEKGIRRPKLDIIKKMRDLAKKNGIELSVDDFLNK